MLAEFGTTDGSTDTQSPGLISNPVQCFNTLDIDQ